MPPRRPQYWAISTRDDELATATFCGRLEAEVVQQAQRACEPWPPGPRGDRAREILRDSCDDTTGGLFPAVGFREGVALYAQQFCPPHKAARAVGLIKRAVQSGAELPLASGQALERELQQQLFQSADAREGISAFNEKRMAAFTAE